MAKSKVKIIGTGSDCPKCDRAMEVREHEDLTKQLKQPYYFKQWEFCAECNYVQHNEDYKVWNHNKKSKAVRDWEANKAVLDQQTSFFNSI